jgi:acetyl-CoA carboxylase biotin carboxylase subunit
MRDAGIGCVPGSDGPLPDDLAAAEDLAGRLGYPVLVKAAGGGGGRGMRVVAEPGDLAPALALTREEARGAFGNAEVYLEKFLGRPRHVEIQVLADQHGQAVWLGTRDCSLQRRHQKVLEEAPAPGVPADAVAALGERCCEVCRRVGYRGLGTFEFLFEDDTFHFIEMNTRLQVEHCVTEMVTGIDLVQQQIRVARGEKLELAQDAIRCVGHALECRINAEHPETFAPTPGRVSLWELPGGPGVRVDSHVSAGAVIPPYYDSLMAKLVVHGGTRQEALVRLRVALDEMAVGGVECNLALHRAIVRDPGFVAGGADIHLLERRLADRSLT